MDFALTLAVQVEGVFARAMVDGLMPIALAFQEVIDGVASGVDLRAVRDQLVDDRADGLGLHILQDEQAHLTAPAQQTEHGQTVAVPRAAAAPLEAALARRPLQFETARVAFQASIVKICQVGWRQTRSSNRAVQALTANRSGMSSSTPGDRRFDGRPTTERTSRTL
jgi:hypothetical protein